MLPLADALDWLLAELPALPPEKVALHQAGGRSLAAAVPVSALPPGPVAAIDGWAVRAAETEGATDYAPVPVTAMAITAGSAMPPGADAVIGLTGLEEGAALAPIAPGENVVPMGHHSPAGAVSAGTLLTALHIALLAGLGHATVAVTRRPRIRLCVSGAKSGPDALTPMLQALVGSHGAEVGEPADLVLLAGRSGGGADDDGVRALTSVRAHGIAIRPGETSAIGHVGGTPAILLPGDPLACATVFAMLAAPVIGRLAGRPLPSPLTARLTRKVSSGLGQLDAIRVYLEDGAATPLGPAEHGSLYRQAHGNALLLVPEASEGYPSGATVTVLPL